MFGLCKYQIEPEGIECLEGSAEISCTFRGMTSLIGGFVFRCKGPWLSGHDEENVSFCLEILLDACLEDRKILVAL